jgi:rRNA processing protein Krr1/Pno1
MSERKVNLEEIYEQYEKISRLSEGKTSFIDIKKNRIKAMKEACRQTLELADKNAKLTLYTDEEGKECTIDKYDSFTEDVTIKIKSESILNTINQIE